MTDLAPNDIAAPAQVPVPTVGPGSDLLCFCGQDWWYHNRAHSDFQLMLRASKYRKVLLVNSIGMRMPVPGRSSLPLKKVTRKLRSMMRHLRRPVPELPNFTVMSPLVAPLYSKPWGRKFNARLIRAQVKRALRKCGIREPHVLVTVPTAWDVIQGIPRSSLTYNRTDKHSAFPEADTVLIESLEQQLMGASDLVLYSSRAFLREEAEAHGGKGRFLDHGVDLKAFSLEGKEGEPVPEALSGVARPIIGFFGNLRDHVVDFELLGKVARAYPNATLLLVGGANASVDELTQIPNVVHLGHRPHEEIPALGRQFDVALMPWLDNDWIRNCNPIKFKEYLALGRNVVSTYFPELDFYDGMVHIARSHDEFIKAVGRALAGDRPPRLADASESLRASNWDHRTADLLGMLDARVTNYSK